MNDEGLQDIEETVLHLEPHAAVLPGDVVRLRTIDPVSISETLRGLCVDCSRRQWLTLSAKMSGSEGVLVITDGGGKSGKQGEGRGGGRNRERERERERE